MWRLWTPLEPDCKEEGIHKEKQLLQDSHIVRYVRQVNSCLARVCLCLLDSPHKARQQAIMSTTNSPWAVEKVNAF